MGHKCPILDNVPCALENVYATVRWSLLYLFLDVVGFSRCSSPSFSPLIFCLVVLLLKVKDCLYYCRTISPFNSVEFLFHIFRGSVIWWANAHHCCICLLYGDFYKYIVSLVNLTDVKTTLSDIKPSQLFGYYLLGISSSILSLSTSSFLWL